MNALLLILLLLILILINVPIAISLGIVSLLGMYTLQGDIAIIQAAITLYNGSTSFPLLAIPLFVFAGAIMNVGGISKRLIAFASALVGCIKGGLGMINISVSLFFAEMSGSAVADVAALGSILIPGMKKRGFSPGFSAAVSSSAASLAIIIPPSIPLIIYGVMAEASIVQLFIAGIIPGLLGAAGLMGVCYTYARVKNLPVEAKFNFTEVAKTGRDAAWSLLVPIIILATIFSGFVTATEGAGIAVVVSLFVGKYIYNELNISSLFSACLESINQTAVVMLLVATSALLGLYFTETQLPQILAASLTELTDSKILILLLLNVFFLLIGCLLHSTAAIILTVPVILPIMAQFNIDPIHFGIVLALNLAIGQQTPPVASVLMTASAIAKTTIWETTRENLGFIGVLLGVLFLVTYVPEIPLFLVNMFYR
jgi:tripartite ATP-independent transporter DctM subunit